MVVLGGIIISNGCKELLKGEVVAKESEFHSCKQKDKSETFPSFFLSFFLPFSSFSGRIEE